jgi:hypothetical protein
MPRFAYDSAALKSMGTDPCLVSSNVCRFYMVAIAPTVAEPPSADPMGQVIQLVQRRRGAPSRAGAPRRARRVPCGTSSPPPCPCYEPPTLPSWPSSWSSRRWSSTTATPPVDRVVKVVMQNNGPGRLVAPPGLTPGAGLLNPSCPRRPHVASILPRPQGRRAFTSASARGSSGRSCPAIPALRPREAGRHYLQRPRCRRA